MKFSKTLLATNIIRRERGNVAIIFALVSSVSLGVLGASIELTRVANTRASLAAAADAGALAAKREQADKGSLGDTLAKAAGVTAGTKTFLASAPGSEQGVSNLQASVTWDDDGSARLTGTGTQSLILGGVVGLSNVSLSAVGVATAGTDRRLEVAVVVDTTASMFQKDGRPTTRFTQMRCSTRSPFPIACGLRLFLGRRRSIFVAKFRTKPGIKILQPPLARLMLAHVRCQPIS